MIDTTELKQQINQRLHDNLKLLRQRQNDNLLWLEANMNPYFFLTMEKQPDVIDLLVAGLDTLGMNRHLLLADRDEMLVV
ncbi:hypothetical protein KAI46_14900, partial [bacterium]|nr:hypothetical protein [bacterium]